MLFFRSYVFRLVNDVLYNWSVLCYCTVVPCAIVQWFLVLLAQWFLAQWSVVPGMSNVVQMSGFTTAVCNREAIAV